MGYRINAVAGLALLVVAQPAVAQGSLEEIVVTAQKRAESLEDVPVAVAAFSAQAIEKYGITDTQRLQAITPGLVYSSTGPLSQPFLRGVGTRLALAGLDVSVATYVDDRYVNRISTSTLEFADIERIEVLKGPQGALYGRNATGGAIRVITKGVEDELGGEIGVTVGNFGQQKISGSVSGPISEDFGFRLTGMYSKRDGYVDNLTPVGLSELDFLDYKALRGKLRWDISETVSATLTLDWWDRNDSVASDVVDLSPPGLNVGTALGGFSGTNPDEAATELAQKNIGDELSGQLRIEADLGAVSLVSASSYAGSDLIWAVDSDGTSTPTLDVIVFEDNLSYSQEFQLLSNTDGNLEWLLGAYYFHEQLTYDATIDVGLPVWLSVTPQDIETDAMALYGQVTWNFNDAWALSVGGRFSDEEKEATNYPSPNAPVTINAPFNAKDSWSEFTPKVTLEFAPGDTMYYLTYARGFKSGGFNYAAASADPLRPEILDTLEFGLKGRYLDNQLSVNASLFLYDYTDLQVTRAAAGANAVLTTENAADAEIRGLDVDIAWAATEALTLNFGASFLDSEYEEYDANAKVFQGTPGMIDIFYDARGESLLRAPDLSYFASLNYDVDLANGYMPISLTYSYKDDYIFDFIAEPETTVLEQEGYGLVSARIGYVSEDERWEAALWGNNLTDEEYFDDIVANGRGLRGSYAPPRTYGIDLRFHF